jgi:hypothetical protein
MNETEKLMVCSECGAIDESYSAYCGNCGRVSHILLTPNEQKEYSEWLKTSPLLKHDKSDIGGRR